jgi:hypothetical protein
MPFELVSEVFSNEPLQCLLKLLEQAKEGEITGFVVGVTLRRNRYAVTVCGEPKRDPCYGRGVAAAIDDELRELVHERAQHHER